MGLFKPKQNANKKVNGRSEKGERKKVKYVWVSSRKAIFIIAGDIKESRYSYSAPIIPLHGIYYSSKDKRKYTAKELANYFVVLNIDKEDADALRGKKIVVMGYNENEMLFVPADGGESSGNTEA